jgi:hypothetical protein
MKTKELLNLALTRAMSWLKKVGVVALIATTLCTGFAIGYYYKVMKENINASEWKTIKTAEKTSVAINERGELLIINRQTGDYTVYQGEVGQTIFQLYAAKAYYKSIGK